MRLRFGAEADLRQLAYTIDQFGDIFPELRTDVVLGCLGVLDDIMQYRGDDHLVIKAHVSGILQLGAGGRCRVRRKRAVDHHALRRRTGKPYRCRGLRQRLGTALLGRKDP